MVDSEILAGSLKKQGIEVLDTPGGCDAAVVNTCAFIEEAVEESIGAILELAELKKSGKLTRLIVTGCLSQRYRRSLKNQIKEIDALFGSSDFIKIPSRIGAILKGRKNFTITDKPGFLYDENSPRMFFTARHFAYVKIQEGCRNKCSYCLIPRLRGPYRSRAMSSVIKEVEGLKKMNDVSEINLIGQDTTSYGFDLYKKRSLAPLLRKIAPIMKNRWIRILYTHPAHYDDELIDLVAGEGAVVKYLDLPVQHISDKILKKMNRHTDRKGLISLLEKLRKKIPGLAIRTTVMVGFPGETDREFNELISFIRESRFERLGCFVYSQEEGAGASAFSRQVPRKIKEARFDEVMKAQRDVSEENNKRSRGRVLEVLIDEIDKSCENQYIARSYMDAPEVDGCVYVRSGRKLRPGAFVKARITDTLEYDLVGHDVKQ